MYKIEKNYNRLTNSYSTFFLNPKEANELKGKLKKEKYLIYKTTLDSEKVIFYKKNEPNICLYEIITNNKLKHQDILGALFSLNVDESMFGDIIIDNNRYYIFILEEIENYLSNKGFDSKYIEYAIDKLDKAGLLNDKVYG